MDIFCQRPSRIFFILGPMAVALEYQRRGIGSALVGEGLAACRRIRQPVVFVLGHPAFYPRFGFEPAGRHGIRSPWPVADDVHMVVELVPGALVGVEGRVVYPAAFDLV